MQAKDIMTQNVITMTPNTTVFAAIDILVNNKISGAPVVDEEGAIVGIVSEKDLLVSLDFLGEGNASSTSIEEFMTSNVVVLGDDMPVQDISQLLVRNNIKRVPIVKDGKLMGIVSRRDVLRAIRGSAG